MQKRFGITSITVIAAAVSAMAVGARADEPVAMGQQIYEERCAICHGLGGKGDGQVGALFENRPGDLTTLQADQRFFPYMEVLSKIDGREMVVGHGTEMPVWGEYLMVEALEDRGINPKDAADIVNGRLTSLVFYLATLQSD